MAMQLIPALLAVTLAASGAALASTDPDIGVVRSVHPGQGIVRLTDGTVYHLGRKVDADGFRRGDKVVIVWDMLGSKREALSIGSAG